MESECANERASIRWCGGYQQTTMLFACNNIVILAFLVFPSNGVQAHYRSKRMVLNPRARRSSVAPGISPLRMR